MIGPHIMPSFWIQTFTGKKFDPVEAGVELIDIRDIAHSLSMQCRFNGHCRSFYSVAEHCVRVSKILTGTNALWGLLHDAAEAYVSDLPRPVKARLPQFVEIEDRLLQKIIGHFHLPWPMPAEVCAADDQLLATEARDLMNDQLAPWTSQTPLAETIHPMTPHQAKQAFLDRFHSLV
jgi:hypothetical protein